MNAKAKQQFLTEAERLALIPQVREIMEDLLSKLTEQDWILFLLGKTTSRMYAAADAVVGLEALSKGPDFSKGSKRAKTRRRKVNP